MARIPSNADLGLASIVRRTAAQKRANARYISSSQLQRELAEHDRRHAARMKAILANSPRSLPKSDM